MALSLIRKAICPTCNKPAIEKSRLAFATSKLISLQCGHIVAETVLSSQSTDYTAITSSDGKKLMPYQIDGVKFAEEANARCLIADEQGLGKTIQALAVLSLHKDSLLPCVIVTKTTIKLQWLYEVVKWTGLKSVQALTTSKEFAVPGMDVYVVTYDLLKTEKVFQFVDIKSLIVDECQAIKNHLSERAKAVQRIVEAHKIEHIIGLSGTPIKNHAGEYFTILNLLQPSRFPTYRGYLDRYCDSYETFYGDKVGGLRNPELFKRNTEDFIIRRTKSEVLKDLPSLTRRFHHVEFDGKVKKAYQDASAELEELFYGEQTSETMTNMIAVMTKMRQITGVSKVETAVDFVTDFLLSTDRKITIFVHHHVVAGLLKKNLDDWLKSGGFKPCLEISASQSGDMRALTTKMFSEPEHRVLIASTLAAGEGLNLQFCSDAILLERQWNPANEEQAEARFHRFGQKNAVTITYMIVSETIDEYFTELVEQKRAIVANTLDGQNIQWEQNSLMRELAEVIVSKGGKRFVL
jgi:SWI/SNF-related matrix-associated actin-dependent regulator of chromatin subfamily A-like protein 1